jgi:hypothetical protein
MNALVNIAAAAIAAPVKFYTINPLSLSVRAVTEGNGESFAGIREIYATGECGEGAARW